MVRALTSITAASLATLLAAGCGAPPADMPITEIVAGMASVEAGLFQMGCNAYVDDACENDERPYHQVELAGFHIDRTEVIQAKYASCMRSGDCTAPGNETACNWDPEANIGHPVVCVTHEQAEIFCQSFGKRLPTEAEWERAARATAGWIYPWGNDDPDCNLVNSLECGNGLVEVATRPDGASSDGTYDMAGNAAEWVADWYHDAYYGSSPYFQPTGPLSGTLRVVRGGSIFTDATYARASNRGANEPDTYSAAIGFRCAMDML